jgi:hypothetical protein
MKIWHIFCLAVVWFLVVTANAIPSTNAPTAVGNNNFTMNMAGMSYPAWFVWGLHTNNEAWKTPNMTSGTSYTQQGSPLYSLTTYYYRACDATGCGAEQSVTTTAVTPLPTSTLGAAINNMTLNGFDIMMISTNFMLPYMWLGTPLGVIFAWMFIVVFLGIWIRTRSVSVVTFLGLISSTCLVVSGQGLNLPIPQELVIVGQMMLYLTITACIVIIIKK